MSVIVWDGKTVAADRQQSSNGFISTTTKLFRLDSGVIVGGVGMASAMHMMIDWYKAGRDPDKFPKIQSDREMCCNLIVVDGARCGVFYMQPVMEMVEDEFMAWGSGSDFAIGALAAGCDAVQAVHIASRYSDGCGRGVDSFKINP